MCPAHPTRYWLRLQLCSWCTSDTAATRQRHDHNAHLSRHLLSCTIDNACFRLASLFSCSPTQHGRCTTARVDLFPNRQCGVRAEHACSVLTCGAPVEWLEGLHRRRPYTGSRAGHPSIQCFGPPHGSSSAASSCTPRHTGIRAMCFAV